MSNADDMRLLAMLVHRRLLSEETARQALAAGDPRRHLLASGAVTVAQWEQWQRTAAGTRPELSRYQLGELLGEGGMARVFRATDRTDGRQLALKVLRPELSKDPTQKERFVREARLLLELDHPHIVKGLRVAKEGEVLFFAMEEVPGSCLQELLANGQRLPEATALQIVVEVSSALEVLHARGLVHRDVKPGNILWSEQRGAVLIDLGFAVPHSDSSGGAAAGTTAGTVHYIAPEQARGAGELDVRADIYALGATLYHLVTGSLPFDGGSGEEVLRKQVLESLSGERIRALGLSPQLHYFIEKMMAKERENRFQDPKQLRAEVAAHLEQLRLQQQLEQQSERPRPRLGDRRPGSGRRGRRH
ncbi:MAG TPA: serine/threonine-protein kinase [Planctomycetota bacterium]|nr:serine/threonine-protein kinase [Planctomycetota bacterium]